MRVLDVKSGIYLIINTITGKLYVGSSINLYKRRYEHSLHLENGTHKNNHLQLSWNKYGSDVFHFCIVEECDAKDLIRIEQLWINATPNCYNLSLIAGSTLGKSHSEETKLKISKTRTGHKWSEASKNKIKGRKQPKEVTMKIVAARKANQEKISLNLSKSLIGNNRRRDLTSWPHELGCKCKCEECKIKRNEYIKNRNEMKAKGTWSDRELSYTRRKVLSAEF